MSNRLTRITSILIQSRYQNKHIKVASILHPWKQHPKIPTMTQLDTVIRSPKNIEEISRSRDTPLELC